MRTNLEIEIESSKEKENISSGIESPNAIKKTIESDDRILSISKKRKSKVNFSHKKQVYHIPAYERKKSDDIYLCNIHTEQMKNIRDLSIVTRNIERSRDMLHLLFILAIVIQLIIRFSPLYCSSKVSFVFSY